MLFQRHADDAHNEPSQTIAIGQEISPAVDTVRPTLGKVADVPDELSVIDVAAKEVDRWTARILGDHMRVLNGEVLDLST